MGWIRIERVTWAERALWAALVLVSIAPVVLQPSAEEVARAYVAAVDRGDVDAALDLTTTDFVLRPLLGGYYYRREAARPVFEWRAALHERWRVVSWDYNSAEREVHADLEITNDAWMLAGSRPLVEVVLVVRDGRILTETIRTGEKELGRDLKPFLVWASAERPQELARAWRRKGPLRRADAAARLLELLREWRAAREVAAGPSQGQG